MKSDGGSIIFFVSSVSPPPILISHQHRKSTIRTTTFSGDIPTSLSSLSSLQVLKLDQNLFAGSIPYGILNCQSLVILDNSSNLLNGALPTSFSDAFPKLKSLNLVGNEIHGRASVFSGLKSITYLNISKNSFHGSAMGVFQERLEVIDLSRNYFQGQLSDVFSNSNFIVLDVSSNQLTGDFFHDLNEAQNLIYLNLAYNRFTRQAFPQIEKLSNLECSQGCALGGVL